MKILMIGDVVAKPGRLAVLERIQDLREQHQVDLAIMNAENLAGGFSVTPSLCEGLFSSGIDVMTSGNHIFDKKEAVDYIKKQPRLLRPANYPPGTPGSGCWIGTVKDVSVAVVNVMGRVFMPPSDDPFRIITLFSKTFQPKQRFVSLMFTLKRHLRRWLWAGTWMGVFQQCSVHTLTCKPPMKDSTAWNCLSDRYRHDWKLCRSDWHE
jgi:Uncharacterized protein conserved in bacteria